MTADRVRWIGDRDDCWLVRLRTSTPLWWTGEASWVSFPNACRWGDPLDAAHYLALHLGRGWRDLALIQRAADAADEWALWFAEVWQIACDHSSLNPDVACIGDPAELVDAFVVGIMAGHDVDPAAMTPAAAVSAQRWAAWSLDRRARILADVG